jgi:hypothetical protein
MRELQDLIRLFLRDWDVRFGPKADFSSGFPARSLLLPVTTVAKTI